MDYKQLSTFLVDGRSIIEFLYTFLLYVSTVGSRTKIPSQLTTNNTFGVLLIYQTI